MENEYLNLTSENLATEHLCCIIRKKPNAGVEAKRSWLSERIKEGHVFRKLNENATVFIEYAPLERAWVPIVGENYFYIYCLWVDGPCKGKGYAKKLMEYCINDAKEKGKSGICMLGAKKQKHWLSSQDFAKKYGFKVVDSTDGEYKLLALSFDGTVPKFTQAAKSQRIEREELTVFYSMQCPYIPARIEEIRQYCEANQIPVNLVLIDSLEKAKALPCAFNNWGAFYQGKFQSVNLLDLPTIKKILGKT